MKNRWVGRNKKSGHDFYSTPLWATKALMERERFVGRVLEPACGNGSMSKVIEEYNSVDSFDINDWGYGTTKVNFLEHEWNNIDNIITNPPFIIASEFLLKSLSITNKKVAFFVRLQFLSSSFRYEEIYSKYLPKKILVFSNRVRMGLLEEKKKGMVDYCWIIWDKDYKGPTMLEWINDKPSR